MGSARTDTAGLSRGESRYRRVGGGAEWVVSTAGEGFVKNGTEIRRARADLIEGAREKCQKAETTRTADFHCLLGELHATDPVSGKCRSLPPSHT